jgi:hypothetical protein
MANTRAILGLTMLAAAVLLPALVWFGGPRILEADPAPNQAGMVVMFLYFVLSLAIGVVLGVFGLKMLIRRPATNRW